MVLNKTYLYDNIGMIQTRRIINNVLLKNNVDGDCIFTLPCCQSYITYCQLFALTSKSFQSFFEVKSSGVKKEKKESKVNFKAGSYKDRLMQTVLICHLLFRST